MNDQKNIWSNHLGIDQQGISLSKTQYVGLTSEF